MDLAHTNTFKEQHSTSVRHPSQNRKTKGKKGKSERFAGKERKYDRDIGSKASTDYGVLIFVQFL